LAANCKKFGSYAVSVFSVDFRFGLKKPLCYDKTLHGLIDEVKG